GEGKWFEAAKDLDRLRPKFANSTLYDFLFQTDLFLGLCYEKLGRFEQARDAYVSAIQFRPDHGPAQFGRQRMETRLGQVTPDAGGNKGRVVDFQGLLNKELQKPKEQRDWGPAEEAIRSIADQRKVDEATIKLMQANLALFREDFPAARKLLQEADELSPHDLQIRRTAVQFLQADPKQGPAAALKLLDRVVKEFDDLPTLRLQRAQLLVALAGEDRNDQLAELEQLDDKWTDEQKSELLTGMAGIYLGLNMNDEARRCLTLVADLKPQDLPTRLAVFQLAMQSGDDEAMQAAQKKILEIVGDESDSTWLYAEARRKLSQVRRGLLGNESLAEIRNLVDRAILDRPNWNELYLLNAELELLAGNAELALQHYEKAAELGRGDATSVAQHIRLVSSQGNFRRAKELLERVPEGLRQPLLGALYTEILFQTNEIDNAIEKARAVVQSDDRNLQNQLWLGQLLARSADVPGKSDAERKAAREEAIKVMERVVELQPDSPDAWYYLTRFHLANSDRDQALKTQRDSQLAVSDADLIIFLAKSHEMLGNWFDAEGMYRTYYDAAPDDITRAQQLAAFYLGNGYSQPDRETKAALLINKILQAGADNKIKPDDANLLWARRMGARILAGTREYQKLRKAENLLASNSQGGTLSLEDKRAMAELLASRPELVSRLKATRLLEEVAEVQPLDLGGGIALGQLYDQVGDWNGAKRQLRATIGRFGDSPQAREAFIRMLLQHGERADLDEAGRQLERLRQIAPNSTATFELGVRLATKTGRQSEARQELLGRLPNLTQAETLEPARVQALNLLANLLVDLEDLDEAEKLYRLLAEKDPNQAYSLARFLGLHRNVEQGFDQLKQIYSKENVGNILAVAIAVVRERRDEIGDKFDAQVEEWFNSALLENPESINLLMAQADFRDAQQRYEDSAEIYRKLVNRPDLTDIRRAIVLNNMSYLLALTDSAGASDLDAMKLVEEAVDILGPTTDILDTRAVVHMAKGDYKKAIDDLEFSVKDTPTAAKYFHKAQAHLGAGDNKAALEAWQRAEELGLTRDGLNRLEHQRYDELKQRIDTVRTSSGAVTHAEPAAR
ncbi:MAG: tetratricopeptide repeat protein, partial [Planctomycetes bacterium]|nr:tetratricopeptide repeat protein [Planctomycetota bacterium]